MFALHAERIACSAETSISQQDYFLVCRPHGGPYQLGGGDECELRLSENTNERLPAQLAELEVVPNKDGLELHFSPIPQDSDASEKRRVSMAVRRSESEEYHDILEDGKPLVLEDQSQLQLISSLVEGDDSTAAESSATTVITFRFHPVIVSIEPGVEREAALRHSLQAAGATLLPEPLTPTTKWSSVVVAPHACPLMAVHCAEVIRPTSPTTWFALGRGFTLTSTRYVLEWFKSVSQHPGSALRQHPLPSAYPAPIQLHAPVSSEGAALEYAFPDPPVRLPDPSSTTVPSSTSRRALCRGVTFYMATDRAARATGVTVALEMCGAAAVLDPRMADKAIEAVHGVTEEGNRPADDAVTLFVVVDSDTAQHLHLEDINSGDLDTVRSCSDEDQLSQEVVELFHVLQAANEEEGATQRWRLISIDDVLVALLRNRLTHLPLPRPPPVREEMPPSILTSAGMTTSDPATLAAVTAGAEAYANADTTPSAKSHLGAPQLTAPQLYSTPVKPHGRGPVGTFMPRDTSRTPSASQMRAFSRRRRLTDEDKDGSVTTGGRTPSAAQTPRRGGMNSLNQTPARGMNSLNQTPARGINSNECSATRFHLLPEHVLQSRGARGSSPMTSVDGGTPGRGRRRRIASPQRTSAAAGESPRPANAAEGKPVAAPVHPYDLLRIRLYAFLVREGPPIEETLLTYCRSNYLPVTAVDHALECAAMAEEFKDSIDALHARELELGAAPLPRTAPPPPPSLRPGVSPSFKVPLRPKRIDALEVFRADCCAILEKAKYIATQWDVDGRPPMSRRHRSQSTGRGESPSAGCRTPRSSRTTTPQRRGGATATGPHPSSTSVSRAVWQPLCVQARREWYQRSSFAEQQQRKAALEPHAAPPRPARRPRAASAAPLTSATKERHRGFTTGSGDVNRRSLSTSAGQRPARRDCSAAPRVATTGTAAGTGSGHPGGSPHYSNPTGGGTSNSARGTSANKAATNSSLGRPSGAVGPSRAPGKLSTFGTPQSIRPSASSNAARASQRS